MVQFCWHVHYPTDLLRISHLARLCPCYSVYTNTCISESVTLPLLFNSHFRSITVCSNSLWDQESSGSIHSKFTSYKVINTTWLDWSAEQEHIYHVFASSALPVKAELRQAVKKGILETCRRLIKLITHELLKRKAVWCEASDNASFYFSSSRLVESQACVTSVEMSQVVVSQCVLFMRVFSWTASCIIANLLSAQLLII